MASSSTSGKGNQPCTCSLARSLHKPSKEMLFEVRRAVWKYKFEPPVLPYMPITVEEVSCVSDLSRWANTRVRVFGIPKREVISWLVSAKEEGGPYKVALDLTHLAESIPYGQPVMVFGDVEVQSDLNVPQIKVYMFRCLENIDMKRFQNSLELQKKHVPLFVKPATGADNTHLSSDVDITEATEDATEADKSLRLSPWSPFL